MPRQFYGLGLPILIRRRSLDIISCLASAPNIDWVFNSNEDISRLVSHLNFDWLSYIEYQVLDGQENEVVTAWLVLSCIDRNLALDVLGWELGSLS